MWQIIQLAPFSPQEKSQHLIGWGLVGTLETTALAIIVIHHPAAASERLEHNFMHVHIRPQVTDVCVAHCDSLSLTPQLNIIHPCLFHLIQLIQICLPAFPPPSGKRA